MKLLLDTHMYLWCIDNDRCLSKAAKSEISNAEAVYVSSVSIWEAAIKMRLGKLDVDINKLVDSITKSGFLPLTLTMDHAMAIRELPDIHKDPFDRILIAQAMSEPLKFLTADKTLKGYSDLIMCL